MLFHKILRRFAIWASYLAIVATSIVSILFFRIPLNFARASGTKNIPRQGSGVLFLANHLTMWDSFLIAAAAFFFRLIFYPSEAFVNFADQNNFFTTWYVKILLQLLRTEPVARRDQATLMRRFVELLNKRNLLIFYQGTRSKNLELIKSGPAFAIRNAKCNITVIPVYHEGINRIFSRGGPKTQGIWRWLPRNFFRRPTVVFGEPIDFSDLKKIKNRRLSTQLINERIVRHITTLEKSLHAHNAVK